MKYIDCTNCHERLGLTYQPRSCRCGQAQGYYNEDGDTITVLDTSHLQIMGRCNHLDYYGIEVCPLNCEYGDRPPFWPYPNNHKVARLNEADYEAKKENSK